jgi:hypothetical protein
MVKRQIKDSVLHLLSIGTIQTFQIEEYLQLCAVPQYEIENLKKEIIEEYQKKTPCF